MMFRGVRGGAVDIVPKPKIDTRQALLECSTRLREAVKSAARARVRPRGGTPGHREEADADAIIPPPVQGRVRPTTERIVCIGASTGGTEALNDVLEMLPAHSPPIVIVQHMPAGFTAAFARRLDGVCQIRVKEAEDGEPVLPGSAISRPGPGTCCSSASACATRSRSKDGPPVSRHRPSVDVLFRSAAQHAGANALGVIMTGMGDDARAGCWRCASSAPRRGAGRRELRGVRHAQGKPSLWRRVEKVVSLHQIPREICMVSGRARGGGGLMAMSLVPANTLAEATAAIEDVSRASRSIRARRPRPRARPPHLPGAEPGLGCALGELSGAEIEAPRRRCRDRRAAERAGAGAAGGKARCWRRSARARGGVFAAQAAVQAHPVITIIARSARIEAASLDGDREGLSRLHAGSL